MKPSDIRGGLDTSVVIRPLTGQPESQSQTEFEFLEETEERGQRLLISDLVLSETYFACQHHYSMGKADVLQGMHQLLSEPIFAIRPETLLLLTQSNLASARPGFIDRRIHSEYSTAKTSLITFEKSASRLSAAEVLK